MRRLLALALLPCAMYGAASISMNVITLAADGLTMTATMSGVTGTLSCPSNACTGVTVGSINTPAASGITYSIVAGNLQILFAAPVTSTETPTVTLAAGAGSNITDTGSDTATGQSNHAVVNSSAWYFPLVAPFSTVSRLDGRGGTAASGGYSAVAYWYSADGYLSWTGSFTSIKARVYDYASSAGIYRLYEDDIELGSAYTTPTDGAFSNSPAWTTTAGTHTYRLRNTDSNAYTDKYEVAMIQLVGGTGLSTIPASLNMGIACGDSITQGQVADSRTLDFEIVASAFGTVQQRYGGSGERIAGALDSHCPNAVSSIVANSGSTIKWVQFNGGVNDLNNSVTVGTAGSGCSAGTFECQYYAMLSDTCSRIDCTTTKMYARGVLPNAFAGSGGLSGIATWNLHVKEAVDTWNTDQPTKAFCYINPAGVFTADATYLQGDNLHLTAAGYVALANFQKPILGGALTGSSFTVTGPSAGTVGVASSTYAVTLVGGATFTGSASVTISDSSAGGTFTPSVGSPGTSTVTVTPSAGATNFTFTYRAASAGTKTLSYSGLSNCWTAPSSNSLVASAAVSTAAPGFSFLGGGAN